MWDLAALFSAIRRSPVLALGLKTRAKLELQERSKTEEHNQYHQELFHVFPLREGFFAICQTGLLSMTVPDHLWCSANRPMGHHFQQGTQTLDKRKAVLLKQWLEVIVPCRELVQFA
jgi:hypothetical protein